MSASPPFITFLSDYGLQDEFVGVCHGVIARRCPAARVIDLTHEIPACDVLAGALVLRDAIAFLPAGVHLAVVDPDVGATGTTIGAIGTTAVTTTGTTGTTGAAAAIGAIAATGAHPRRAVALRVATEDRLLVGPDNGLLMPAAAGLGGVVEAVDIGASPERLRPLSATFHGRDVFAPVAAALAAGTPLAAMGEPLDPALLCQIELPCARVSGEGLHAHVLSVDRFGNVALDAQLAQLEQAGLRVGGRVSVKTGATQTATAIYARTFADVARGELLLHLDARGMVALAINQGSAAGALGLAAGDEVLVQSA